MKWYAEGFERRTGIKVKVDISPDLVRLPPDVEVTLFRVIQESLTNVHRYSGSPKAYVRVKVNSGEIEVQIGDFGKGMHRDMLNANTGKVAPLGVGIQGMKERMRQLSGKLEITSRPNDGTVVTATLPFSQIDSRVAADTANNAASALPTRSAEAPAGRSKRLTEADSDCRRSRNAAPRRPRNAGTSAGMGSLRRGGGWP